MNDFAAGFYIQFQAYIQKKWLIYIWIGIYQVWLVRHSSYIYPHKIQEEIRKLILRRIPFASATKSKRTVKMYKENNKFQLSQIDWFIQFIEK